MLEGVDPAQLQRGGFSLFLKGRCGVPLPPSQPSTIRAHVRKELAKA